MGVIEAARRMMAEWETHLVMAPGGIRWRVGMETMRKIVAAIDQMSIKWERPKQGSLLVQPEGLKLCDLDVIVDGRLPDNALRLEIVLGQVNV